MLQQKVSEPTRNSLWEDQDEVALGQGFFSSTDLPPFNKQLSSSFPVLVSIHAPPRSASSMCPLFPNFPAAMGCPLAPVLTFFLFDWGSLGCGGLHVSMCIIWSPLNLGHHTGNNASQVPTWDRAI